jgi:dienelactone hydrolase
VAARLALLGTLWIGTGCQSVQKRDAAFAAPPTSFTELERALLKAPVTLDHFDRPGPFKYHVRTNVALQISPREVVVADLAIPDHAANAPLVIISHGNHSRKEAHRYQAERLASFGMYAMTVQLPNSDHWLENGATLAKLGKRLPLIEKELGPDARVDPLIMAGHSFGGSAVTVAAAKGAPVRGLILLDPALVADVVKSYARQVHVPVMLLGADAKVFRARHRASFFANIGGEMGEVSVRGATHDDAQGPSMFAVSTFGLDPFTSPVKQEWFSAAITASAFSIAATGGLDYIWKIVRQEVADGDLKQVRRRAARDDRSRP